MDNGKTCGTGGECDKPGIKCLIPIAAVFATLFVFQWVYHGVFMMPMYEATASQWRPQAEMESLWWVCIVSKLVMAGVITCLYCCMAKGAACGGKCHKTGLKFGVKIGLLLGAAQWASYAWLPISMQMAVLWLLGDVIMGALVGVVLSFCMRMCKKGSAA